MPQIPVGRGSGMLATSVQVTPPFVVSEEEVIGIERARPTPLRVGKAHAAEEAGQDKLVVPRFARRPIVR